MFLGCWFVKLDLQYYHIMVCWNTELQYSVIQLLRKHHIDHCLGLLMLSLWCYFYVHFESFSKSLSCFDVHFESFSESSSCLYVHFQSFSESLSCFYVHFQSFSESSSCFLCTFSVIQWVIVLFWGISWWLLAFIIKCFWYIFRTSGIQCPVWRCHWRNSWCINYCNHHFRDHILQEKER